MPSTEPFATKVHAADAASSESNSVEPRSDLIELCFPKSAPVSDEIRRLAYANSICMVFLVLAIVGIKTPIFFIPPPAKVEPTIPVVFEPPPEQQQQQLAVLQPNPDLTEPNLDPIQETPQVVNVVAADSSQVAFAIPVEGPVLLKPAAFAAPPPRTLPAPAVAVDPGPPQPVEFSSGTQDGGFYPEPEYPKLALQRRVEGRVMLYVVVDEAGMARSVEVRDSSGSTLLDKPAVEIVKRKWHWPPGKERHYLIPFRFEINK